MKRVLARINKGKAPEWYNDTTWASMVLEDDDNVRYTLAAPGQEEQIKRYDIKVLLNYREVMNSI